MIEVRIFQNGKQIRPKPKAPKTLTETFVVLNQDWQLDLAEQTNKQFAAYAKQLEELIEESETDIQFLFENFMSAYEFRFKRFYKRNQFSRWIRLYSELRGYELIRRKSGERIYVKFKRTDGQ